MEKISRLFRSCAVISEIFQEKKDYFLFNKIASMYKRSFNERGAKAKSVFWTDQKAQDIRFHVFVEFLKKQIFENVSESPFFLLESTRTLRDFGCGYGALLDYLEKHGYFTSDIVYYGEDLCSNMIHYANQKYKNKKNVSFQCTRKPSFPVMYTFASGIFGLKMDQSYEDWTECAKRTLKKLLETTEKALVFNMLHVRAQPQPLQEPMRLYYADPHMFREYFQKNFSASVEIVENYAWNDWTMIVHRKS